MVYSLWSMVYGLWSMVYGLWSMVYGLWSMVYGLWSMVYGLWSMVCGLWSMVYGLWSMVYGLWSMVYGRTYRHQISSSYLLQGTGKDMFEESEIRGMAEEEKNLNGRNFMPCLRRRSLRTFLTSSPSHE